MSSLTEQLSLKNIFTTGSGGYTNSMVNVNIASTIPYGHTDSTTDQPKWQGKTVKIGNQIWMAENLNVTHYRNGSPIHQGVSDYDWVNVNSGMCASYNDDPLLDKFYGKLYNYAAVNHLSSPIEQLAPEGWHIPSREEWLTLMKAMGPKAMGNYNGAPLAGRQDLWNQQNDQLRNAADFNTSGFNVLPAGYKAYNDGDYLNLGNSARFWSESSIDNDLAVMYRFATTNTYIIEEDDSSTVCDKRNGYSVRCIKD